MTKTPNLNNTRPNELGATPFFLAAVTADAELMQGARAARRRSALTNAENSTPLMVAAGIGTRSPGEDAGTESEVLEALQVLLDLGADLNAVDMQRRDRDARRRLQEPSEGREVPGGEGRQDRGLEPRTSSAGRPRDRRRLPVRQLQAVARTEAAIREVMIAAGVTPPAVVVAKTQQIY